MDLAWSLWVVGSSVSPAVEFRPPCPGSVSPWGGLAGGLWGPQPESVLADKPYASAPTQVLAKPVWWSNVQLPRWRRTKPRAQKGLYFPLVIWGRETVAVTLAALSGEPAKHLPRVMQGTGVTTGTLGVSQDCSWSSGLSTSKRYSGIFKVLGCLGSLASVHRPLTCLASMSNYCLPSIGKVFLHG